MTDYDVVVIGSGMGGLTCALALARAGQKVCIVEQHDVPGGYCHSFQLEGFRFSPGVHYIGQYAEGEMFRQTLEGLGAAEGLVLFELNRDGYEHIKSGDVHFDIPAGEDVFRERLVARFPNERKGITEFLRLVSLIRDELGQLNDARGLFDTLTLPFRTKHMGRYGLFSLDTILRDRVKDVAARGVLSVQCGDHGLTPSKAPFALHAAVVGHYLEGGAYPAGGGGGLVKAMTRALRRNKVDIHTRARVEKILIENGTALGVKLVDGREIRAGRVISNADPAVTWGKLVGEQHLPAKFKKKLQALKWSISAVSLFCVVRDDLRRHGLDSGNYWLAESTDAEQIYSMMQHPEILERDEVPGMFATVTTMKDPSSFDGKHHVMEAFTFVPGDAWQKYQGRGPEYLALKERFKQKMLRKLELLVPDLRKNLVMADVATPLTNTFYCEATHGALYGTEKSRWQIGPWAFPPVGPIKKLACVGASTMGHGIHGTSSSGLAAAARMLECRPSELLTDKARLTVRPAESASALDGLSIARVRQVA